MSFLGRKFHGKFEGDVVTDEVGHALRGRLPGHRVKHWMKQHWLTMDNKAGSVLRVETVIKTTRPREVLKASSQKAKDQRRKNLRSRMREFVGLRATRGGFLHTEVPLGARVKRGDILARILSVCGHELETITSPWDGVFVRSTTLSTGGAAERVPTVALLE